MKQKPFSHAVVLVLFSVILGLVGAWALKKLSMYEDVPIVTFVMVMALVVAVNAGRFIVWGYVHKHFPLSLSYPFNSLFFPAILVLSYYIGESITAFQVLAVFLITLGVAILAYEGGSNEPD